MAVAPAANSRFIPNSGDVCSQRVRPIDGSRGSSNSITASGSRCRSTTVSADNTGVSTSRKPLPSKNSRTRRNSRARSTKLAGDAVGRKSAGAALSACIVVTASGADAFDVVAGPRVDLDHISDVDERRTIDLRARLHLDRLRHVGRCVALDARLAVLHLQHDMVRR